MSMTSSVARAASAGSSGQRACTASGPSGMALPGNGVFKRTLRLAGRWRWVPACRCLMARRCLHQHVSVYVCMSGTALLAALPLYVSLSGTGNVQLTDNRHPVMQCVSRLPKQVLGCPCHMCPQADSADAQEYRFVSRAARFNPEAPGEYLVSKCRAILSGQTHSPAVQATAVHTPCSMHTQLSKT
jgi:hypothetical protein